MEQIFDIPERTLPASQLELKTVGIRINLEAKEANVLVFKTEDMVVDRDQETVDLIEHIKNSPDFTAEDLASFNKILKKIVGVAWKVDPATITEDPL